MLHTNGKYNINLFDGDWESLIWFHIKCSSWLLRWRYLNGKHFMITHIWLCFLFFMFFFLLLFFFHLLHFFFNLVLFFCLVSFSHTVNSVLQSFLFFSKKCFCSLISFPVLQGFLLQARSILARHWIRWNLKPMLNRSFDQMHHWLRFKGSRMIWICLIKILWVYHQIFIILLLTLDSCSLEILAVLSAGCFFVDFWL